MKRAVICFLVLGLAAPGCVTRKHYTKDLAERERLIDLKDQEIKSLEAALTNCRESEKNLKPAAESFQRLREAWERQQQAPTNK